MKSMNFSFKNKVYKVSIKKSKIKNLYLRVKNGNIIASVPRLASKKLIKEFVEKNIENCVNHLEKIKSNFLYSTGQKFIFLREKKHQILILKGFKNNSYKIIDDNLYLETKNGTKLEVENLIKKILEIITFNYVFKKIPFFEQKMNLQKHDFKVSYRKSYWGKNFINKNIISFSSNLSHLREELTDYIIVHELTHNIFPNHSKDFWKIVEKYKPNFKELNKKLKDIF